MEEIWKGVVGFEQFYQISTIGRVKSLPRKLLGGGHSGTKTIRNVAGRLLKQATDRDGYNSIQIWLDKKCKVRRVHHLVLEAFVGPCPEGMECRHLDGNPANNNLENLCWGTKIENHADRIVHGTRYRGANHHCVLLTEEKVLEMRKLYATGDYLIQEIADLFGIKTVTANAAISGRTWTYLPNAIRNRFGRGAKRRKILMDKRKAIN